MPIGPLANLPIFGKRRNQASADASKAEPSAERTSAPMTQTAETVGNDREREVLKALSAIQDPDLHRDIVSLGLSRTWRSMAGR